MNLSLVPGASLLAVALVLGGCGTHAAEHVTAAGPAVHRTSPRAATHLPPPAPPKAQDDHGSPFDLRDPGIANLDPDLRAAVQAAARDARADGVRFSITSGWRSRAHQQDLLNQAVARYRSLAEALRYVSLPDKSAHVTGHAVDVGPTEADSWLSRHGSRYGLCQVFANEVWHYELATDPGGTCPQMLPDSSYR